MNNEPPLRGQSELERHHPRVAQAISALCERQPWCVTGVSALLRDDVGFWFELTKPKHWVTRSDGATLIGLGAIGGSLEPGESLLACLERECQEEIGQMPAVLPSSATVIVYEEQVAGRLGAAEAQQPAPALLTVSANLYSQQRLPQCRTLAIVTYWGRVSHAPALGDLFGLVRLPQAKAAALLRQPEVTAIALQEDEEITILRRAPLPERAVIRPVWTVRSLQLALQRGMLSLDER